MLKSNYRSSIILSILVFLVSCKNDNIQKTFNRFPAEYSLQPQFIELEEVFVHASVLVYDTLYFLTNTPGAPLQIHIYSKDFTYLGSVGRVGNGPGEIVNPFMARIHQESGVLWFADMGRREILKFPVDSFSTNLTFLPDVAISIPDDLWILHRFDPINDELFRFADYQSPDNLIEYFNNLGHRVDSLSIKRSPLLRNLKTNNEQAFIPTFMYEFHPKHNIFAVANVYSDVLAILNHNGEIVTLIKGPDGIDQVPDYGVQDQVKCYSHIQVDEKYIYVLYNGKPSLNAQQKVNIPERIFVFDWEGEPVALLKLEHPIPQFTLDKLNNRFVSMSLTTGEIVIYNIPEELLKNFN